MPTRKDTTTRFVGAEVTRRRPVPRTDAPTATRVPKPPLTPTVSPAPATARRKPQPEPAKAKPTTSKTPGVPDSHVVSAAAPAPSTQSEPPIPRERIPAILFEDDADQVPVLSGPGRRYEKPHLPVPPARPAIALPARPQPEPEPEPGPELEEDYGVGRVWLAARDPHTLHVSWELAAPRALTGGDRIAVRVRAVSEPGHSEQEILVGDRARSVFVRVDTPGCAYVAEVGRRDAAGAWHSFATSQPVATPPQRGTVGSEPRFVRVVIEPTQTDELPPNPAQVTAPTPAPAPPQPSTPTPATPDAPVPQTTEIPHQPPPTTADTAQTPPSSTDHESVATEEPPPRLLQATSPEVHAVPSVPEGRVSELRALQPEPFTLTGAPGVAAPIADPAAAGNALPVETTPTHAISRPVEPAPRGDQPQPFQPAPAPAGTRRVRFVDTPRFPIENRASRGLEELILGAMAQLAAPSSAALPGLGRGIRDSAAPPTGPGAVEAGLPSSGELKPTSVAGQRQRAFWFMVNAELIVYGATEPDAQVFIDGESIPLRPDGTFTLRFALPDGAYGLSVVAMAAHGEESRSARLNFLRRTAYRGEVGTHPNDPTLTSPPQDQAHR